MIDSNRFYGWISAAVHRGVKYLDLNIYLDKFITLPDVLFTCRTLVSLKVDKDFVLDVPRGVVHLPNLNTLHLESVKFLNDDSIKNLLSGCSNLEDMILKQCYMENISKFNISHQLLKRLTIDYLYDGYHCGATTLFRGICNVPSLILWVTSLELLLSCKPLPVFATFFKLKIPCYDLFREYSYIRGGKGLETLLSSLPALEKLEFSQEVLCFLPENVPSCLLYKLKAIKITNFTDEKHCIGKAKYFLKNGGALQKLTILTAPDVSVEKQLKISNVLSASPRESKQLCILIV
ncbi:F-box/FBD/LRR-repeat protein At3g52680-like [Gossypium raimondii]|uniref:F-box/FBD/LRR-repeat protein At3g52680-like n=1 Tax=Gossypium raimondii TaxID=29730 RepID=UPI00227A6FDD|nr:F-box/FBD/LRR-repeat protein At3g52680-like [Gossypium raimondii]